MLKLQGRLRKMPAQAGNPTNYQLHLVTAEGLTHLLPLNPLLGQQISLQFSGNIHCINCARRTNKSFAQGYCYPCFKQLPQCDTCIVRPETCHYFQGTCRDPAWGEQHCLQPHLVYLANTTGLKVGITRAVNTPTRWLDQGAVAALPLLQVPNRLISGQIETTLAQTLKDKTAWQRMLKNDLEELDLPSAAADVLANHQEELEQLRAQADFQVVVPAAAQEFTYPVLEYPTKIKSLNLDKTPLISGLLLGIKGQYLILDNGVINLRKYAGYELTFQAAA